LLQSGIDEVGAVQSGPLTHVSAGQDGTAQGGTAQVGTAETGAAEIGSEKVCADHVELTDRPLSELRTGCDYFNALLLCTMALDRDVS
jgi:hypothetical protein